MKKERKDIAGTPVLVCYARELERKGINGTGAYAYVAAIEGAKVIFGMDVCVHVAARNTIGSSIPRKQDLLA